MNGAPDDRDARLGPTMAMRRATEVLQHLVDGVGWKRKAHTLLPGNDQGARCVPTTVMRREGGCCRAAALGFNTLRCSDCLDQCYVEDPCHTTLEV